MSALEELQELFNADPDTERISLRARGLEHIDAELEYLQLHFANIRHLDLSENALEWLPVDFGQLLPKLVALDVTKNRFRSVADLGEVLQKCASLKSLSVTLKNETEEKLLLVMLPKLRILNGTPLSSPASPPPPSASPTPAPESPVKDVHALSAVLLSPSTASNSSAAGDDNPEPREHCLSPPPAPTTTAVAGPPLKIPSPQDKRTLRLQFANLKLEHQAIEQERQRGSNAAAVAQDALTGSRRRRSTAAASMSSSRRTTTGVVRSKFSSVRPTETPASISDDRTDWRKLLKSQPSTPAGESAIPGTAITRAAAAAVTAPVLAAEKAPTPPRPASTETFLAQLKAVVKSFHQCDANASTQTDSTQLAVYEQLDRHVDQLAQQLSRQEREQKNLSVAPDAASTVAHLKSSIAMLQTRWNLLEVCGMFGVERASGVDGALGQAFGQLLKMQKQVLVALQHQQVTAAAKAQQLLAQSTRASGDGTGSCESAALLPAQQLETQMRVLLEVAESLESDLEAAQTRLQQEKAQRELLEQENWSLKRENDAFKRKPRTAASSAGTASRLASATAAVVIATTTADATHDEHQSPVQSELRDASMSSSRQRIRKRTTAADGSATDPSTSSSYAALQTHASSSHDRGVASESPPPLPRAAPPLATHVRNLTLKQLMDLIQCITASKRKSDTRVFDVAAGGSVVVSGAPRETMEQHMYAYLNQRFGLHVLIVDYASAIWKSCEAFAKRENDAAVFLALLRNELDEGFLAIKRRLKQALVDLLRAYFQAKHPLKQELAIAALVQNRVAHHIFEDEWQELLTYLYDPQDSSTLLRLVKQKVDKLQAASMGSQRRKPMRSKTQAATTTATPLSLPFAAFEQVLFDYQLQGRIKLLEDFHHVFASYDADHVGIVTRDAFVSIVRRVAPKKSDAAVEKLLETLDPFQHDIVTFSDAANCLMGDIRSKRPSPSKPPVAAAPARMPATAPLKAKH